MEVKERKNAHSASAISVQFMSSCVPCCKPGLYQHKNVSLHLHYENVYFEDIIVSSRFRGVHNVALDLISSTLATIVLRKSHKSPVRLLQQVYTGKTLHTPIKNNLPLMSDSVKK